MIQDRPVRMGVIVPRGNTVHAREFERLTAPGLTFRFEAFDYPPFGSEFCSQILDRLLAPLQALAAWGADVVLFGCTTASMMCRGNDLLQRMETAARAPVVTAGGASCAALQALGAATVSVATPYGERNNAIIANFLTDSGFEVAALAGLDLDRTAAEWLAAQPGLTADRALALTRAVERPETQSVYLPCTGMVSLDAIVGYEAETGKPAVSSVQAGYWAALRTVGFDARRSGAGRLLETWTF